MHATFFVLGRAAEQHPELVREIGELVLHALNLDGRHRRALDRRQQHAPHGVADRRSESPFERLRGEPAKPIRQGFTFEIQTLGPLKTFPQHCCRPFACGRSPGPPDLLLMSPASRRRSEGCGPMIGVCCAFLLPSLAGSEDPARTAVPYFEYSSTISCSCTGRLICCRVGSDEMRADEPEASTVSHSGTPRPLTSSIACLMDAFSLCRARTATVSPWRTAYDGMSTFLPLT